MSDDLIRNPLQQVNTGSGTQINTGLQATGMRTSGVAGAIAAGINYANEIERQDREENEAISRSDVAAFSNELYKIGNNYKLMLSQTTDPNEIDSLRGEYRQKVDEYMNNPQNLRTGRSKQQSELAFQRVEGQVFDIPAATRKVQINKENTAAKATQSITDAITDATRSDAEAIKQITESNQTLVDNGTLTEEQAKVKNDKDIKARYDYQSKEYTAAVKNRIDNIYYSYSKTANEIAAMPVKTQEQQAAQQKEFSNLQKNMNNDIEAQKDAHYKLINDNKNLTNMQKQSLIASIHNNAADLRTSLQVSYDAVKEAKKRAEVDSWIAYTQEQMKDTSKVWTPQELKATWPNMSAEDVTKIVDRQLADRKYSNKVNAADEQARLDKQREWDEDKTLYYNTYSAINTLTPNSSADDINSAKMKINGIKSPRLASYLNDHLKNATTVGEAPDDSEMKEYYKEFSSIVNNAFKDLDGEKVVTEEGQLFDIKTLGILHPFTAIPTFKRNWEMVFGDKPFLNQEVEVTPFDRIKAQQNMEQTFYNMWKTEGKTKAMQWLDDNVKKSVTKDSRDQAYIELLNKVAVEPPRDEDTIIENVTTGE